MTALSAGQLLDIWDLEGGTATPHRMLTLLSTAHDELTPERLEGLTVGTRDALLLELRVQFFGSSFASLAMCPSCGDRVELEFDAADIRTDAQAMDDWIDLSVDGFDLQARVPRAGDLLAVAALDTQRDGLDVLLDRCVRSARHRGQDVSTHELPEAVIAGLAARLSEADPQADVILTLDCEPCAQAWHVQFDIASFLWEELRAWAARTFREVHMLASAYGWTERDVLAMSPHRRTVYLEMIAG